MSVPEKLIMYDPLVNTSRRVCNIPWTLCSYVAFVALCYKILNNNAYSFTLYRPILFGTVWDDHFIRLFKKYLICTWILSQNTIYRFERPDSSDHESLISSKSFRFFLAFKFFSICHHPSVLKYFTVCIFTGPQYRRGFAELQVQTHKNVCMR